MIKVSIQNHVTSMSYGGTFETQAEADAWIALCTAKNSWGLGERWAVDDALNPLSQEQKAGALDSRPIGDLTEYKLPAEYVVTSEDVTAEHEKFRKIIRSLQKQAFGREIVAEVAVLNEQKNVDALGFAAILESDIIQKIERLLLNGSLELAKDLIASSDLAAFYSAEEKTAFVDKITAWLNANQ